METGSVKFFDPRLDKLFGVLTVETGGEIWFHYSDGRFVSYDDNNQVLMHTAGTMKFPKAGDKLMFDRGENAKGPKAAPWCFKSHYDGVIRGMPKYVHRSFADLFDLPIPDPEKKEPRPYGADPDAIGGHRGISWYEYFKDAKTGVVYQVFCSDGVNGGKLAYTDSDYMYRQQCFNALGKRFIAMAEAKSSEIRISRNERALIQGFDHSELLESEKGRRDGAQSNEGIDGGLVGHYHGIPVICDLELADDLPARETETVKA